MDSFKFIHRFLPAGLSTRPPLQAFLKLSNLYRYSLLGLMNFVFSDRNLSYCQIFGFVKFHLMIVSVIFILLSVAIKFLFFRLATNHIQNSYLASLDSCLKCLSLQCIRPVFWFIIALILNYYGYFCG